MKALYWCKGQHTPKWSTVHTYQVSSLSTISHSAVQPYLFCRGYLLQNAVADLCHPCCQLWGAIWRWESQSNACCREYLLSSSTFLMSQRRLRMSLLRPRALHSSIQVCLLRQVLEGMAVMHTHGSGLLEQFQHASKASHMCREGARAGARRSHWQSPQLSIRLARPL